MARKEGSRRVGTGGGGRSIEPVPQTGTPRMAGIASFLYEVSKDQSGKPCPCERCCNYRDMSRMILNPGTDF